MRRLGPDVGAAHRTASLPPLIPLIPINLLDPEHSLGRDYTAQLHLSGNWAIVPSAMRPQ
jgi:hypothetical protein